MFRGSLVAIVTPMKSGGEIDYQKLEQLISWQLDQGTQGLVVLGTTGESPTIRSEERKKIIKQVVAQVKEQIPVIVGAGTNATEHSVELTRQAMEWGADAALIVTPYYNKPTQEGLYQHFSTIAREVPLPQILYNVPSRTGCDLLPETIGRLAAHSNVVAVKEATGDLKRVKAIRDLDCEINLLSGTDSVDKDFILLGGQGFISVTANVAPKAKRQLADAALEKNQALATQIQNKLDALNQNLFIESNPIPVKWSLAKMGKIEKGIRLPLTWLNEKYHRQIEEAMRQAEINFN